MSNFGCNLVKLFLLSVLLFFNSKVFADEICEIEIRANDPKAVISIDGTLINSSHQFIDCKETPQNIIIAAPGKKPFVRVIPAASDFNKDDNFWNVRLQSYSDHAPVNQVQDLPNVSTEVDRLRDVVAGIKSARPAPAAVTETAVVTVKVITSPEKIKPTPKNAANSHPVKMKTPAKKLTSAKITPDEILKKEKLPTRNMSSLQNPIRHFDLERVSGTFFQIKAISKFKASRSQVITRLKGFKEKLGGVKITVCGNPESENNYPSTLLLFGPVQDPQEASNLAKRLGSNTIQVQDPVCEKNSKISFRFEN